jgi:pimeloyl-ACP methyl ester carboxylesterase
MLNASTTSAQTVGLISIATGQNQGSKLYVKRQGIENAAGDVVYVHGATFSSDLSVFFQMDNQSWANSLNQAGFNVWGFDFLGFGKSDRYASGTAPRGLASEVANQLATVVAHIQSKNGGKKVSIVAHSWGTMVAAKFAIDMPAAIDKLVLFGAVIPRDLPLQVPPLPAVRPITVWEQYRRFIEDVPKGAPPVLLDKNFERWAPSYLESDSTSSERQPKSVMTPTGPIVDIYSTWQGKPTYDAAQLSQPTLLVRGEWDSLCNDADAAKLMSLLGSKVKQDVKIPKGTHLMHLEESRTELHSAVNAFLKAKQ